jgi:hypothetical protein
MATPNPNPGQELAPCRTYYTPQYLNVEDYDDPADMPNDSFSHTFSITLVNEPEGVGAIRETILSSSFTTNDTDDEGTSIVDNGDHTYTYAGMYTIDSFPNISMTFRTDFENNIDETIVGWPPSDPRAKDMFNVSLDPRDSRTYEVSITWNIQTETYDGSEWEITDTGTDHSYTWIKDASNKPGHYFGTLLGDYFS